MESIAISKLISDPSNARKHSEKNIAAIKGSLAKFGQQKPIVVDKNNVIVAGNGTLEAAKALGWNEIKYIRTDLTGSSATAFAIADNRTGELAEWDDDVLSKTLASLKDEMDLGAIGFDDEDLQRWIKEPEIVPGCDEDEVPEHVEPKTKLGDLWILGQHRVLCGDSTNVQHVERLMGGEKADMVFTDPPYGVAIVKSGMVGAEFGIAKKGKYKEVAGDETTDCAKEFYQTCEAYGFSKYIIWGGNYFTDFLEPSKSWVIWNKRDGTDIKNTFADAKLAWSNIGFPARIHNQLWNGMIRSGEHEKRMHPTQKPIALAEYCFKLAETKTIYDGFLGSGSTLIACEKTKRKCFGMEVDPHYCDAIVSRWEKFTGKEAKLGPPA